MLLYFLYQICANKTASEAPTGQTDNAKRTTRQTYHRHPTRARMQDTEDPRIALYHPTRLLAADPRPPDPDPGARERGLQRPGEATGTFT